MGLIFSAHAAVSAWRNNKRSVVHIPADQVVHLNNSKDPFLNCPVVVGEPVVEYEDKENLEMDGEFDSIHKL